LKEGVIIYLLIFSTKRFIGILLEGEVLLGFDPR
jgi:hypothetical protein